MVIKMSSGRIDNYKEEAKAEMRRCNGRQIRCPCRSCKLVRWIDPDSGQLEEHLLRRGFMEGFNQAPTANAAPEDEGGQDDRDDGDADIHGHDCGGEDVDTPQSSLMSALMDSHVQELLLKNANTVREKAKLAQMEIDGNTPLYPGCRPQDTRLQVTLDALEMKSENKWTDASFNKNMQFFHERLPEGNTLPTSIEEAKKVVCPLDLPHVKYHACVNDCAIYRGEYEDRTTCPVCGQGRYKSRGKKVPQKVVWYFYITPRLQRYFVDPKEAKLMQWHAEREKPEEDPEKGRILTHPSDASQWQELDAVANFGGDARNVRLGMSTDGLNPFDNQSSTHSTWPVFVWPYNLPPWLCTKQKYIHMSILIQEIGRAHV